MGKAPADQFYWGDWLNDTGLQSATTVARGVWINMLCRMWFATVKGELSGTREELAKLCNANVTEFVTLENDIKRHHFADLVTDPCNGIVTVRNRRMYRKGIEQKNTHLRVNKHRQKKRCNANVTDPCNANVTVVSSSSSSLLPIIPQSCNGNIPEKEILSLWSEVLPELPEVKAWSKARRGHLKARWEFDKDRQKIEWWKGLFEYVRGCQFLMGKVDPPPGRKRFFLTLPWLIESEENFLKVMEGTYK